jgi:hypothetical protein
VSPEFEDLVEGVDNPRERERLRRVHQLLTEAGPPPELSPALASVEPPAEEVEEPDASWLPPRRLGAALVLAAALLLASFGVGYLAGNRGGNGGSQALEVTQSIILQGSGRSTGVLSLGKPDADGNTPMQITVRGLAPLKDGDYYRLALTKGGKPVVTCTTFNVGDRRTKTIRLVAAYDLEGFDGWAVTHWRHGSGEDTPVLSTQT